MGGQVGGWVSEWVGSDGRMGRWWMTGGCVDA